MLKKNFLVLLLVLFASLSNAQTLQPWPGYPHLGVGPTIFRPWLVVKCTLSDNRTVPLGLDQEIAGFLTVGGSGTGNITDFYSDVSYGAISLAGTKVVGWYPVGFDGTEPGLAGPNNRYKRVQLCADAIPASDAAFIDFGSLWGIIMVVNHPLDSGACFDGQNTLQIRGSSYNLACVILNSANLYSDYSAHEVGHGLGMPHSFDDTRNMCGGAPGEYCDKWDIMSAENTYSFFWPNYGYPIFQGGQAGPGVNVPNLLFLGGLPASRVFTYHVGSPSVNLLLGALSHPLGFEPLAIEIVGSNANDIYTVEYRQADGWDEGLPVSAVLIHEYKVGATPYSYLQTNAEPNAPGGWLPNTRWVAPGGEVQVRVNSIDASSGMASITIGPTGVDLHELRLQGGSWVDANLSAIVSNSPPAVPAVGDPFDYVTPDGVPRVVYRGEDNHIHELRRQGSWIQADLSAIVSDRPPASPAAGKPFAYVTPDGVPRVVYRGEDSHIHELRLQGGWIQVDLSAIVSDRPPAIPAAGDPFAYVTPDGVPRVVYRGEDNHIHELRLQGGWIQADLSTIVSDRPPAVFAASDPFAYVTPDGVPRVVYRGQDSHIHEMRLQGSWVQDDLSAIVSNRPPAVPAAGDPFAYVTPDRVPRVIYRGQDNDIHELRLQGSWMQADLSAIVSNRPPAVSAAGDPFAYVTSDGVPRIVYRGQDNDVHELRRQRGWIQADLSAIVSISPPAPPAASDPRPYVTPESIPRIVYRTLE
jgi:hypothetical protein